jgi:hypothetical protein
MAVIGLKVVKPGVIRPSGFISLKTSEAILLENQKPQKFPGGTLTMARSKGRLG